MTDYQKKDEFLAPDHRTPCDDAARKGGTRISGKPYNIHRIGGSCHHIPKEEMDVLKRMRSLIPIDRKVSYHHLPLEEMVDIHQGIKEFGAHAHYKTINLDYM